MAVQPTPAVLRSLRSATDEFPLDRKLLVSRSMGEGRELLRALAVAGEPWIGWEITTPRRLALDLAGPELALRGLALTDDYDQEAGCDVALSDALVRQPDSQLARLGDTPGFRQAVAGAIRELGLAGIDPPALRRSPASNGAVRNLLADVLEGYDAWLAENRLVGVAEVMDGAAVLVAEGGAALFRGSRLFLVPGLSLRGVGGRLLGALMEAGARPLAADPVSLPVPDGVLWSASPEPAPLSSVLEDSAGGRPQGIDLQLMAASGPSDEVREVLRRIMAAGLAWDEVEIVATDPVVYGGALHAQAQRLGIPVSFAVGLPVERTRTGRAAAAYFRWIQSGFPESEIRRLLESGDLRPRGWDGSTMKLARRLRLLRIGWGQARYFPAIDRALRSLEGAPRPRRKESDADAAERVRRERSELESLRELLGPILGTTPALDLTDPTARVAPGEIAAGLRSFLEMVAPGDAPSRTARDRLLGIADRIAARLIRPMPVASALAAVRRHLQIRVPAPDREGSAPWVSSGGHLHLSDIDHGGLTGRRVTFVVGLDAERVPGAGLQDPLLLDAQRRALDPAALPTSADRMALDRFRLAATLARLRGEVTLSYSAWDPVEARETAPSAVMLQAFRMASGEPTASFEDLWDALGDPASAIPRGRPLDDADLWLDALDRGGILLDGTAAVREAYPSLAAGTDALAALAGDTATAHHGLVRPRESLDPRRNPEMVLSASGLEDLGTCALRFFYKYALRLRPPDDPELDPDRWLDALRRGSLLHGVFERTLREARERGLQAGQPAFTEHALAVLESEAAALLREVPSPGDAVRERELVQLREDVRSFAAMVEGLDDRWEALELTFGLGETPVAELPVRGGTVRLRGAIDRVDREPDGSMVVIDYKTGATGRYDKNGLFHGGRRLQNAIYAAVAEAVLEGRVSRMEYHFPTRTGRNEVVAFSRDQTPRGLGLVSRLLDMAAAGRFLPTPQGDDCRFCDFAAICRHRVDGWSPVTPLADWAAGRFGEIEEYAQLRDVRDWENLFLAELETDE